MHLQKVAGYDTVISRNVEQATGKILIVGTVLHIAKPKTGGSLVFSKTVGEEKRTRREANFFRLVFCRYVCISQNVKATVVCVCFVGSG